MRGVVCSVIRVRPARRAWSKHSRINALATMPRQDGHNGDNGGTNAALAPHGPAAHSFADWLKQTIDKRK